ncbi:hypothetical protein [Streptomyces mirabilis]|uniref:hypothetical protein n=1 Tax=Streptomyces mirabilis TaxID=68239 RepID=UPI0033B8528E
MLPARRGRVRGRNYVPFETTDLDALELGGAWVPWYNLHKLSADLLDAHRHSRSDLALTA